MIQHTDCVCEKCTKKAYEKTVAFMMMGLSGIAIFSVCFVALLIQYDLHYKEQSLAYMIASYMVMGIIVICSYLFTKGLEKMIERIVKNGRR